MALQAYQSIGYTGANITTVTPGGLGDRIPADPNGFLWVKNGGGVSTTVTVIVPGTVQGQALPDITRVVTAGSETMIGPLVAALAAPDNGLIDFGCVPQASVTIAAVKVR